MSKQYFTKFLPVEEEIERGDKISYTPSKKTLNPPDEGIYTVLKLHKTSLRFKEGGLVNKKLCKKVKLFLCSRDIQVGDDIQYSNLEVSKCKATDTDVTLKEDTGAYKVIGEISTWRLPWVKEGDEFDDDEVEILQVNGEYRKDWKNFPFEAENRRNGHSTIVYPYSLTFGIAGWKIKNPTPDLIKVKIKCLCCNKFI